MRPGKRLKSNVYYLMSTSIIKSDIFGRYKVDAGIRDINAIIVFIGMLSISKKERELKRSARNSLTGS